MIKVMVIDNFPVVCNRVTETRNTLLHQNQQVQIHVAAG